VSVCRPAGERYGRLRGMRDRQQLSRAGAPSMSLRAATFEDVPRLLQLIEGAIEHGCREDYDRAQLRAVYLGYASRLFVEAVGPFQTFVVEVGGRMAAVAQIDVDDGVLRALFVDAAVQGRGLGRSLLAAVEERARAAGCSRLRGAMSLNAVSFYAAAGFRSRGGRARLRTFDVEVPVVWMEKSLR
jgi:putative acetyltransferase